MQFIDANGNPLANGSLYTYAAGTDTPRATYSDNAGTANANPVVLDSAGRANIWINDALAYKYVLKDSVGAIVFTIDNINNLSTPAGIITSVSTVAALKLITGTSKKTVNLLGYYAENDGGGGQFYYDTTSSATADDGMVIKPTAVTGAGRWLRIADGFVSVRWYGAKGDNSANDVAAFQSADTCAVAAGWYLLATKGTYVLSTDPALVSRIKLEVGAILKWSSGTYAIKAIFDQNDFSKHFTLSGSQVTLDCLEIYPEWFGALGNASFSDNTSGTNDTVAIQMAFTCASAGQTVVFNTKKKYRCGDITLNAGVGFRGSQPYENETNATPANEYLANIHYNGSGTTMFNLSNGGTGGLRGISVKD
jgi:hypothetical protein